MGQVFLDCLPLVAVCQENKGGKVQLSDHMRKLWAAIGFNPTSFKLEDYQDEDEPNTEKPDTKQEANVPDKHLAKFGKRIKVEKSNFQII